MLAGGKVDVGRDEGESSWRWEGVRPFKEQVSHQALHSVCGWAWHLFMWTVCGVCPVCWQ